MVPQKPDKIIVLIEVRDPVTFNKDFVGGLKYSPYVTHMDPMNRTTRDRKIAEEQEAKGTEDEDDHMTGKFAIEVDPVYFGEFVMEFVSNPTHQRHLSYVDYSVEPLPDEGITTEDLVDLSIKTGEDIEDLIGGSKQGLVHLYILRSGQELPNIDEDGEDLDSDDDEDEDSSDPEFKTKIKKAATSMLLMDSDGDTTLVVSDEDEDDDTFDVKIEPSSFVIGTSRSIH